MHVKELVELLSVFLPDYKAVVAYGETEKNPKPSAKAARRQCATSQASRLQRHKSKSCNLKRLQDAGVIERGPLHRTACSSSLPWGISLQKLWYRDVFSHSRSWAECRTANCCASCILSTDHQLKDCREKAMALNCSLLILVFYVNITACLFKMTPGGRIWRFPVQWLDKM